MKRELTYADQAKRIQNKYKGRTDKLSMDSMHRELAALEQQQEAIRAQMNLIEPQQMAAWGGPGGYVNQPDNNLLAMGGMIKRADGSYSKRGLWDNIRANKGSGKKPTAEMLKQEKKIKAEYANGGGIKPPDKFDSFWRKSDSTSYAQRGLRNDIMKVANSGVFENIDQIENARKFGYNPSAQEIMDYYRDYGRTEKGKFEKARVEGEAGALKKYQNNKYLSLTNQDVIDLAEKVIDNNGSYIFEGSMANGSPKANLEKTLNKLDLGRVKSMVDFKMKNKSMGGSVYANGGGIHIDPSKKGTFTAAATKHGKSVQGFASQVLANKENYSPAMVKKANFAKNASKWKHAYGGPMGMYFDGTGKGYNGVIPSEETINKWNQMYPKTFDEGTEDGLKYLTPQPTPEFEMPYDQMVKTFGVPPSQEDYPVTAKVPFKPGYSEQKPKQKQPFNYLGLTQLAGPLMDLYYGIKGPDQVNFDRVRAEQINLAPQTQADLVRRGSSLPMYLAKQQGLGQGNYLNTLAAISGKAGENIGKSYLESKLAQEQFNAQAKTGANAANAQIAMQESIARQQERDAARSAVTKGAGELGKGIATLSIDPRLESAQSKQNKILKAIIVSQFPNMNLESLLT